jgi:hypothetical protein
LSVVPPEPQPTVPELPAVEITDDRDRWLFLVAMGALGLFLLLVAAVALAPFALILYFVLR